MTFVQIEFVQMNFALMVFFFCWVCGLCPNYICLKVFCSNAICSFRGIMTFVQIAFVWKIFVPIAFVLMGALWLSFKWHFLSCWYGDFCPNCIHLKDVCSICICSYGGIMTFLQIAFVWKIFALIVFILSISLWLLFYYHCP